MISKTRYLEECSSLCPNCEETGRFGRLFHTTQMKSGLSFEEMPIVEIKNYCYACGFKWVDLFKLVDVEF